MIDAYHKIKNESMAAADSNVAVIAQMLGFGISHILEAKGCLRQDKSKQREQHIVKATEIVAGLRSVLDFNRGGDIAANLDQIYVYVEELIYSAHLQQDETFLDMAVQHLRPLKEAWEQVLKEEQNNVAKSLLNDKTESGATRI